MSEIVQFRGASTNDKVIFGCTECGSRSFKLMRYGATKDIVVRCANCETKQYGMEVVFDD